MLEALVLLMVNDLKLEGWRMIQDGLAWMDGDWPISEILCRFESGRYELAIILPGVERAKEIDNELKRLYRFINKRGASMHLPWIRRPPHCDLPVVARRVYEARIGKKKNVFTTVFHHKVKHTRIYHHLDDALVALREMRSEHCDLAAVENISLTNIP